VGCPPAVPYEPFADAIEELSGWYGYIEEGQHEEEGKCRRGFTELQGEQAVSPYKKVGRNDLCPCGSGKKFKKYCLQ